MKYMQDMGTPLKKNLSKAILVIKIGMLKMKVLKVQIQN